jgi:general stress protein YciG
MDTKVKEYLAKIGRCGGQARAARHDRETLSKWAKLGGRPRKKEKKA